ncbi:Rv2175c family DNA-binding protein [Naasia lichenicola]|uniref:DNA-binding protein n=1 Tax=Naasia lichenicola TaxID=2565933 RepID=A0A4S4FS27_9MICO|nr:Rv2175c family DNA-binding protein [Naasia lichenicola]THG33473.1 DNA-binding protein [Naasia lichenicola]
MSSPKDREWVTLPDLAERFSLPIGKVRRLLEERHLIGLRIDGVLRVPVEFLDDEGPLQDLRGTIILLGDNGFSDDEAVDWLLSAEDSLGGATPVDALRAGRKAEVRRVAQALA